MTLIELVITLVVVGLILWAINQFVPMDSKIKTILNVAVVIMVLLWVLQQMGLIGNIEGIQIK